MNFEKIFEIYPNSKVFGVREYFVPGVGWIDCLIGNLVADVEEVIKFVDKGFDSKGREITIFTLIIENEEGRKRYSDFKKTELM